MTQIGGFVAPTRRPGELGVHSVDLFSFAVPDLNVAADFYRAFGLDVRGEGDRLSLYTDGHAHRWGQLVEGAAKKLSHITFGVFEDDIERFRQRLQERGVRQLDPPTGLESNGVWFRDPDGVLIELRVAEKSSPNEKSVFSNPSSPPGVQGSYSRSKAPRVRPRRLAHVLLFTSDVPRSLAFYRDVLGLRLSDRSGEGIAFMHGIHGSDHHMIAFAKSNGAGLHHLSWDVGSVNDVGLGAMQMADKGFSAGWGVGRHVLGSNYFHYVRDPWGSWCEYSSDIDYIPADHDWASGDHAPEDAFYVWGPTPPDDFVTNHEAAR
ncbi:MAG TPA: VOC family protein [Acetobacteraceae bacterium]|jgi:catechol 2,3-dioxygenase|nr:VOC family protein [Acetobacteraceae bacterium]